MRRIVASLRLGVITIQTGHSTKEGNTEHGHQTHQHIPEAKADI